MKLDTMTELRLALQQYLEKIFKNKDVFQKNGPLNVTGKGVRNYPQLHTTERNRNS